MAAQDEQTQKTSIPTGPEHPAPATDVPPAPSLENLPTIGMSSQEPAKPQEPQPPTQLPPQPPSEPPSPPSGESGPGRRLPKLPLKPLAQLLVILLLLAAVVFAIRRFVLPRMSEPETITLTYWGLWEEPTTVEAAIKAFEAQEQNIEINYVKQSKEDYRERLVNSLARGAGPDIFRFHNTWVPMLSGNLSPLPAEVMDAQDYGQSFYPVAAASLRSGTSLVGIPLMFDGLGLYINEDIFSQVGFTPPATWDQLRQVARELTVKGEQGQVVQAGVALGRTDNVDHWQDVLALMMLQNGADLANPQGELAENALEFFTLFATTDAVWDKTLPSSTRAFAAGTLAMYFAPSWRAHEIRAQNPNLRFRVVPVPQLPKVTPSDEDVTWASFWAEGVWNKSPYKEQAWEFLHFLSARETLQEMYGQAAKTRLFGPPYPRPDLAPLASQDPIVAAFLAQAPNARSWYLASRTFDGATGINSRISSYFADAVNAVVDQKRAPGDALKVTAQGVREVLADYNLVSGE